MAKRILWLREEFLLVLGLYLKIPYLDGNLPSPQDIVDIIFDRFGISRTVASIQIRLHNFESCNPIRTEQGIKGMEAGKESCMPYWKQFAHNKEGLLLEINKILSKDSCTKVPQLQFVTIIDDDSQVKWSKLEALIAFHLALTRVPADVNNPLIQFFAIWFNYTESEVSEVVSAFTHLLRDEPIPDDSICRKMCMGTFAEYELQPEMSRFAAKLAWEDILTKSLNNYVKIDKNEVHDNINTVLIEDPVFEMVKEMTAEGFSKLNILSALMNQFAEKGLSFAEWSKIVTNHLSSLAPEDDDTEVEGIDNTNSSDTEP